MLTILSLYCVVKPRRCAASPTFHALSSNKLVSHYGPTYLFIFTKYLDINYSTKNNHIRQIRSSLINFKLSEWQEELSTRQRRQLMWALILFNKERI